MKTASLNQRYLMIETLSQFIAHQYSLNDALLFCHHLFKEPSLLELIDGLKAGTAIEDQSHLLYNDTLFKEFFKFYLYRDSLDQALIKAIELCKQKDALKQDVLKAMIYPCLLLSGVLCFSFIATFYLQPQFNQFFASFDIHFSYLQQCLIQLLFIFPFLLCFLFLGIGIVIIIFIHDIFSHDFKRLEKWNQRWFFGNILKKYFSIKFCLYYKEFLYLGYDLHTILDMITKKIIDTHLQMITFELENRIKNGIDLINVIEEFSYFDPYFKMIFKLSLSHQTPFSLFEQYYQMSMEMMKNLIHKGIQIALPILYGFIGVYIVGIYSGMVLPMMNMLDKI